ncbi:zinc finger protein 597 [Ctenodactylus gundi]
MASTFPTSDAQEPVLLEDLAVHFSQEECVSLHPAQKSLNREAMLESFEDVTLMAGGECKTEANQQSSPASMELEEPNLENYSIAAPLVHYPETSSEDGIGISERKISGETSTCKRKLISLLVTIENPTPLVELSQCLGVRTLSEILDCPWEETTNVYNCPECDQNFSDNSYLLLHQKIHLREKKYKCGDCGKIFSNRANLRTHRRIHAGEKPFKCTQCDASFRQQSHLSRHMHSHGKEKPYTCSLCGRGFMWLPGLVQHQKSHTDEKVCDSAKDGKYFGQKTNPALYNNTPTVPTMPYQHTQGIQSLVPPSLPALPEESPQEDLNQCSIDDENFFSFSRFKPLQCSDCDLKFPCFFELFSHQNIHKEEKPYKCETCSTTFALESELVCHQKSHRVEGPFKCSTCGKSFKVNIQLISHKRTHRKNTL